jgi:hypothetical protein
MRLQLEVYSRVPAGKPKIVVFNEYPLDFHGSSRRVVSGIDERFMNLEYLAFVIHDLSLPLLYFEPFPTSDTLKMLQATGNFSSSKAQSLRNST